MVMKLRRADTTLGDNEELANVTYNDKYVVVYEFANVSA
jgi:anoctamin-10